MIGRNAKRCEAGFAFLESPNARIDFNFNNIFAG
ncbi:hypothetical protein SMNI109538_24985 [Smaragdicoccus niigatensis]